MKKFLFTIFTILIVNLAFSLPITQERANAAARGYFKVFADVANPNVKLAYTKYSDNNVPVFYVYNLSPKGFVMISADDAVQPILASSLEGEFVSTNMPANLSWWLDGYKQQIQYAIDNKLSATSEITAEWEKLFAQVVTKSTTYTTGTYLCKTKWDQNGSSSCRLYNNYAPLVDDSETPTGCFATAMAQVMRYWCHPRQGQGSYSYVTAAHSIPLSANFGATTYDWKKCHLR